MSKSCEWIKQFLDRYQRGELSGRELEATEKHLSDCAACRAVFEAGDAGFTDFLARFKDSHDLAAASRLREAETEADSSSGRSTYLSGAEVAATPLEPALSRQGRGESFSATRNIDTESASSGSDESAGFFARLFTPSPLWRWFSLSGSAIAALIIVAVLLRQNPGLPDQALQEFEGKPQSEQTQLALDLAPVASPGDNQAATPLLESEETTSGAVSPPVPIASTVAPERETGIAVIQKDMLTLESDNEESAASIATPNAEPAQAAEATIQVGSTVAAPELVEAAANQIDSEVEDQSISSAGARAQILTAPQETSIEDTQDQPLSETVSTEELIQQLQRSERNLLKILDAPESAGDDHRHQASTDSKSAADENKSRSSVRLKSAGGDREATWGTMQSIYGNPKSEATSPATRSRSATANAGNKKTEAPVPTLDQLYSALAIADGWSRLLTQALDSKVKGIALWRSDTPLGITLTDDQADFARRALDAYYRSQSLLEEITGATKTGRGRVHRTADSSAETSADVDTSAAADLPLTQDEFDRIRHRIKRLEEILNSPE